MKAELLIAGIPAGEWVNRRVRFWGQDVANGNSRKRHPTPCLVKGISNNRKVIILPIGHKQTELVDPSDIAPTWKNNDDLRQKYAAQLNGSAVEDPPDEVELEESLVETDIPEPEPEPVTEPTVLKTSVNLRSQPKLVIHRHDIEWQPTYQKYVDSLKAEADYRALLEEVNQSIATNMRQQAEILTELEALGIEVVITYHGSEKKPDTKPEPFKIRKGKRERIVGTRMTNELVRWGHHLRQRIENGESIEGTVNGFAKELDISWETLRCRFDVIEKRCRLSICDEKGNHGRKASGFLKITAV